MRFSINISEWCRGAIHKEARHSISKFHTSQWTTHCWLVLLLFCGSLQAAAQAKMPFDSLQNDLLGALNYLADSQCRETITNKEFKGEWPAYMQMHKRFIMLGKRYKYRDSNSFTTSGIYNLLAEMYLADTLLRHILPMLQASYPEIQSYAVEQRFNFWKSLPPTRDLQKGPKPDPLPLVRRPTHYKLSSRYINNAANVENDADDTASGNLAVWYHQLIFGNREKPEAIPLASFELFDAYRDEQRKNRHWYNYLFNGCTDSGAYMTWLGQEHMFKRWNIFKTIGHNQIFYLKGSICYPIAYKPYIPYGTNDVDAVVNANVLTYLAKKGDISSSKGQQGAHHFIHHQALYRRWSRAGHYYPNRYHFHYAVSRALASGDTALLPTAELMLRHLMASQQKTGSYRSRRRVNHGDELQSTTYALLAMLNFKSSGLNVPQYLLDRTVVFLHHQRQIEANRIYWKGGVYFSGGTVVRNVLYFTSDAYTTALVAQSLQKYMQQTDKNQTLTERD